MTLLPGTDAPAPASGARPAVEPGRERGDRIVLALGAALVLATLANGAGAFLRRVGVLDQARYEVFWATRCGPGGTTSVLAGLGRRCTTARDADLPWSEKAKREEPLRRHVYEVPSSETWLKLGKDAFVLALVGISLVGLGRGGAVCAPRAGWALWGLAAAATLAAVQALASAGPLHALAGARGFGFLAAALVGGWAVRFGRLRIWSSALVALLFLESLLLAWELLWGLPIFGHVAWLLPRRLAGTLVLPNTLGVVVVCALAFVVAFDARRAARRAAWTSALLLVAASGSATGWLVILALAGALWLRGRSPRWPARLVLAVSAVAILALLPRLVARPDVYESILGRQGRLDVLLEALAGPFPRLAFGRGLGAGTNTSLNAGLAVPNEDPPADSTVTLLVRQTGLLGAGLFYAALLLAWRRDPEARPFLLVALLTSATATLPEVFPVNVLLGLVLARSANGPPGPGR